MDGERSSEDESMRKKNQRILKNRQKKKSRKSSIMSLIIRGDGESEKLAEEFMPEEPGTGGNICSS